MFPIPDVDHTAYWLILGANPVASNGSIMTVPDVAKRLKAIRDRGGKVVVIDPCRTETAEAATRHHFIRPGTDAAFLVALLNAVLELGPPRVERYGDRLDGLDRAIAALRPFGVERAASATGISAADIRTIAKEFRDARGAVAYGRVGLVHATVRHDVPVAHPTAEPRDRQPRRGGRRDAHAARGAGDRARDEARGIRQLQGAGLGPQRLQRRAARGLDGRRDRDARRRPGARDADNRGQPGVVDPERAAPRSRLREPRVHGCDRHLRERDHAARARDPAAGLDAVARKLRRGLQRVRRAQRRAPQSGRLPQARRRALRLGDLQRHRDRVREGRRRGVQGDAQSHGDRRGGTARGTLWEDALDGRAEGRAAWRGPGAARAFPARPSRNTRPQDPLRARGVRRRPRARGESARVAARPRPAPCCSWDGATCAATTPGCTTPIGS